MLFPQAWGEFGYAAGRVLVDAQQHVGEIGVGVDVVQLAGADQALDEPDVLGADLGPAEQPVLAPHGDGPQVSFEVVGIQRHLRVFQEHAEGAFAGQQVVQRPGERAFGREILALELRLAPLIQLVHHGLAVRKPVRAFFLALKAQVVRFALVLVERTDPGQRLLGRVRLARFGVDELPARMRPALRMGNIVALLGVARIGGIAVADQRALEVTAQGLLHVPARAAGRVGEHQLVVVAVQRPEPALFHFALARFAGLDGRLIHRQHPAAQYVVALGLDNGAQQLDGSFRQVRQRRPAERDAGVLQALVLTIQRQMVGELVHQQPGEQAHIGEAAIEHVRRRRARLGLLAVFVPQHGPLVLQHHIAGRTLRQAVGGVRGDDFVRIRVVTDQLLRGGLDHLDRHVLGKTQASVVDAVLVALFLRGAALIGDGALFALGLARDGRIAEIQAGLVRVLYRTLFRCLAEHLLFEPAHAVAQHLDFRFESLALFSQCRVIVRCVGHGGDYTGHGPTPHGDSA